MTRLSFRRHLTVRSRIALALALAWTTLCAARADAAPPGIIRVAEIKPGMTGYGLTVFQGTEPDRFDVRVVAVLKNFLPRQDIILIRSDDPRLKHSGIVAGMSGSPIFLEGRVAGAIAYGWQFAKDPIAGVTPIENMIADAERPLRGPETARTPMDPQDALWAQRSARETPTGEPRLQPASLPLSVAGLSPPLVEELRTLLAPYGLVPLAAGGTRASATATTASAPFALGSSISVQLVRGDISVAATGTVTWVEGDRVIAFGHPMFNIGEVLLPLATSEVHTFMSAMSSSFKMATPLVEAGALLQDRQTGVSGSISRRAPAIPMQLTVRTPGRADQRLLVEIARHRFLSPLLASTVIANAAQSTVSDVTRAVATVRSRIAVRGYAPIELTDDLYSADGVSARALGGTSGIRALTELLGNPFAPAEIERFDLDVDVQYRSAVADIVGVGLSTEELEPGSRPALRVTLRPWNAAEIVESIPIDIPRELAGLPLKINVSTGAGLKPDMATPESLRDVVENLRRSYSGRSLVVSLDVPDEGVAVRGRLLPGLPDSVIDTLRSTISTRRTDLYRRAARIVVPTALVIQGRADLVVRVAPAGVNP